MTAALVRHHTAGSSTALGTTVTATVVTAPVAVGNLLVVWVGFDNLTGYTPTVSSLSVPTGETAVWYQIAYHNASNGSSGLANRGEMWACWTTIAWPVGTVITATLSASVYSRAMLMSEFSGTTAGLWRAGSPAAGNSTVGTPSVITYYPPPIGALVVGGGTFESNVAPTGDTDTVNGSWSAASTKVADTGLSPTSTAVIMQYKVVTADGNQTYDPTGANDSGANVASFIVNLAPNAPTLNTPGTGTTINLGVTNRFALTFSDPNVGDSLSRLDLRYKLVGAGSWTTVTQSLPQAFYDFAPATFAAGNYEWQACTYDSQGLVGPYSASSFFTAAVAPTGATITAPTNGSTVSNTATVTWSVPAQTDYQIRRVADVAGAPDATTVYYDSGDVVDGVTRSVTLAFPVNLRWEHIQVSVKASGLWSAWADCHVDVSWTPPMVPSVTAAADSATASIAVVVTNPVPTGGEPVVSYNDIYVSSPLDTEFRAATLVPPNTTWTWKKPGAVRAYSIRAVAVGTNGTTSTSVDGTPPIPPVDEILDGGVL